MCNGNKHLPRSNLNCSLAASSAVRSPGRSTTTWGCSSSVSRRSSSVARSKSSRCYTKKLWVKTKANWNLTYFRVNSGPLFVADLFFEFSQETRFLGFNVRDIVLLWHSSLTPNVISPSFEVEKGTKITHVYTVAVTHKDWLRRGGRYSSSGVFSPRVYLGHHWWFSVTWPL